MEVEKKEADKRAIVVFDSGVGGLPYLEGIRKLLPSENYSYVADTAHFPYGEKSAEELTEIIHGQMGRIIERVDPKIAVIACNTASVVALADLRAAFGIPFVGVVPAIKPAAEQTSNGRIGLLATRKTVDDPYTHNLEQQFAAHCEKYRFAGVEIVELVERNYFYFSREKRRALLQPAVDFFLSHGVDQLVIACTHFIFLEAELNAMLGKDVMLVDSRDGVAGQTRRILENEGLLGSAAEKGENTEKRADFFVTGGDVDADIYKRFADLFGLRWMSSL